MSVCEQKEADDRRKRARNFQVRVANIAKGLTGAGERRKGHPARVAKWAWIKKWKAAHGTQ